MRLLDDHLLTVVVVSIGVGDVAPAAVVISVVLVACVIRIFVDNI